MQGGHHRVAHLFRSHLPHSRLKDVGGPVTLPQHRGDRAMNPVSALCLVEGLTQHHRDRQYRRKGTGDVPAAAVAERIAPLSGRP